MTSTDETPLAGILPNSLRAALGGPPYFSIATSDGVLAPTSIAEGGHGAQYRLGDTGLVARVGIRADAQHRVAVQSLTLVNEGDLPSPPIHDISTISLSLTRMKRTILTPRRAAICDFFPPRAQSSPAYGPLLSRPGRRCSIRPRDARIRQQ